MWIASVSGWFSVVVDAQRPPGWMLVRARCRADIWNLYSAHAATLSSMEPPTSDERRDYRWRMSISKTDWVQLAARLAQMVDYPNFKSAVHRRADQANKSVPYMDIWTTMHRVQLVEGPEAPQSP